MTATANTAFTAADFNREIRDNLNCTAPANAGVAGSYFITQGVNQITERQFASDTVATSETTTSTSYTDLATVGPEVTVTTNNAALVWFACQLSNGTANTYTAASVAVTGDSNVPASNTWAMYNDGKGTAGQSERAFSVHKFKDLTPGSNTFTMQYRVGTAATTGTFLNRHIVVMPL
jgi:hypothetical protein